MKLPEQVQIDPNLYGEWKYLLPPSLVACIRQWESGSFGDQQGWSIVVGDAHVLRVNADITGQDFLSIEMNPQGICRVDAWDEPLHSSIGKTVARVLGNSFETLHVETITQIHYGDVCISRQFSDSASLTSQSFACTVQTGEIRGLVPSPFVTFAHQSERFQFGRITPGITPGYTGVMTMGGLGGIKIYTFQNSEKLDPKHIRNIGIKLTDWDRSIVLQNTISSIGTLLGLSYNTILLGTVAMIGDCTQNLQVEARALMQLEVDA